MFDHNAIAPAPSRWHRAVTSGLRLTRFAPLFAVVALLGLGPREASAGAHNFVYVESNDPAENAIFGFSRNNADGSLTPLPGSPFPAGGLGITLRRPSDRSTRIKRSSSIPHIRCCSPSTAVRTRSRCSRSTRMARSRR